MSCLSTTRRLPGYLHCQGRWVPFPYRERLGALLDHYLARLFRQDHAFFLPGPANDRFHAADIQRNPIIPSSALLAPPVSSPCLDTNEGIDLQATGSSGCLSSQLCQMNQMWKGESSKLLVEKGYWKAVGAKLLPIVVVTFCSIPTNGANCRYLDHLTFGASTPRCKLAKKGVRQWCVERRKFTQLELPIFPSWGVFLFSTRISP